MKRIITVFIIIVSINTSYGQNRFFSIGKKDAGICFGNSAQYNGLRLNLFDKNVKIVNGVNLALISGSKKLNGVSISAIGDASEVSNGVSIGGIALRGNKRNGIGISIDINCDTLNGFFIGGIGVAGRTIREPMKIIKGFASGLIAVGAEKVYGLMLCGGLSYSKEQYGISIAGYNKTENLHGFQFGLLNYAGNNRKLFRRMPLMNFNLRKHDRN